jgi:hypothetical protein
MKFAVVVASIVTIFFGAIEVWLGFTGILGPGGTVAMIKGSAGIANAALLMLLLFNRHRLKLW